MTAKQHFYSEDLNGTPSFPCVIAEHFCATLHVNVDNAKLSDADFREFVRNTLPIVSYKRPEKDSQTA